MTFKRFAWEWAKYRSTVMKLSRYPARWSGNIAAESDDSDSRPGTSGARR